jgi:aminoglycoside phosphotransferase (APT) family kinase protein
MTKSSGTILDGEGRPEGQGAGTAPCNNHALDNVGTTPVRTGYGFDEPSLERWMLEYIDSYAGPLTVEQFKGGQSNPTYKLTTPSRSYVLRRKPPGVLLKGAHAVDREARVMAALGKSGFPVPKILGVCTDESVIGTWFYVMEMVAGRIVWDATFPEVPRGERAAYFDAMNGTLAQLHSVDYRSVGLEDFGRVGGYLERQLARLSKQYLEDELAGRDPYMDRLLEWLPAHIPAASDATTIIHGDLRCDNMIFHPTEPRVLAVLDWELATLGHPLADFAYHAMMYRMPPTIVAGLAGADLAALGIPDENSYVAAYLRRTGRPELPAYDYYVAFNFFRLAAIFHGIKGRAMRGTAASAQAKERAAAFTELARLGWQQACRAGAR